MARQVLAIDIGGTNVKFRVESDPEKRSFPSGPTLTPQQMLAGVLEHTKDWKYDAVSIGLPAPIIKNQPACDPANLGQGWTDFDYDLGFNKPAKLLNDAAMQAVGSYNGGRMLFLGLGTGLGSCLIIEHVIVPTELAHMPYKKGLTYEEAVGKKALKKNGRKTWEREVHKVVDIFAAALLPDSIVIGGGNSVRLKEMPKLCTLGENSNAFVGGFRLWQPEWAASVPVYDR